MEKLPSIYKILREHSYWGNLGAGILPICGSTGRILIALRSEDVMEPGTYGIWGGKIDLDDEFDEGDEFDNDIESAALREFNEETGYTNHIDLHQAYIYKDGKFEYHNFIGILSNEFEPILNWESESYSWLTLDELLRLEPKHFGLAKLLNDQQSMNIIKQYADTEINELFKFNKTDNSVKEVDQAIEEINKLDLSKVWIMKNPHTSHDQSYIYHNLIHNIKTYLPTFLKLFPAISVDVSRSNQELVELPMKANGRVISGYTLKAFEPILTSNIGMESKRNMIKMIHTYYG